MLSGTFCQLLAVGGCEERAVQAYGIFFKKLAQSDPRNRIVLAFRLHAGTPVRLQDLKLCFGECWADGAITSAETVQYETQLSLEVLKGGVPVGADPLRVFAISLTRSQRPGWAIPNRVVISDCYLPHYPLIQTTHKS